MELTRVEGPFASELSAKGLEICRGWNERLAYELVASSRQLHILENTPNDNERRFTDYEAAIRWHDLGKRAIYSMHASNPEELAGVIWYDVRPRPEIDATHTFAIRIYERALGRGLASTFMHAAHDDFVRNEHTLPTVWLERNTDDKRTKHLYEKFGYADVEEKDGRTTMVLRPTDKVARFYDDH